MLHDYGPRKDSIAPGVHRPDCSWCAVEAALAAPRAPEGPPGFDNINITNIIAPFLERDIIKYGALSRGRWREYEKHIEALGGVSRALPEPTECSNCGGLGWYVLRRENVGSTPDIIERVKCDVCGGMGGGSREGGTA